MCVRLLNFSTNEFMDHVCAENGDGSARCVAGKEYEDIGMHLEDNEVDCPEGPVSSALATADPAQSAQCAAQQRAVPTAAESVSAENEGSSSACQSQMPYINYFSRALQINIHENKGNKCSVNKKNRYRSWVYQKVVSNYHGNSMFATTAGLVRMNGGRVFNMHSRCGKVCSTHVRTLRDVYSNIRNAAAPNRTGTISSTQQGGAPQSASKCLPVQQNTKSDIHARTQERASATGVFLVRGIIQGTAATSQAAVKQQQQNPLLLHPRASATTPKAASLTASKLEDQGRVSDLIRGYVEGVLCSPSWHRSMQVELKKNMAKKKMLCRGIRDVQPNNMPVITSASVQQQQQQQHSQRSPNIHSSDHERRAVSKWCVDVIHKHICLINSMCSGIITEAKLKSTTVGLLYMIRQGIIVHELVVLPRLPNLDAVLPLESHLDVFFGVKAKCITETENVVKIILRNVTKQQLIDAGVARVAHRF